jgi:hypothetical protein
VAKERRVTTIVGVLADELGAASQFVAVPYLARDAREARKLNRSRQAPVNFLLMAISCAWQESNLRPRAPEARALSPELQARESRIV